MVQLITFLLVVAALLILVLQNLSPVLGLVVLGNSVGALPISVWLLGAIAIGALCTLLIYQLVPQKRAYRPMGRRLSDPVPEPSNRFVDSPDDSRSTGSSQPPERQNPYDNDWENFSPPAQWDDWGQRPTPDTAPTSSERSGSVGDAVRDIESGWGDDDYEASARHASRQDTGPDIGWDDRGTYSSDGPEHPSPRTYEEGWLYGSDTPEERLDTAEPGEPTSDESEDENVYDANYRVIIPPYDAKDKEG